jgi:hypothetical protein
LDNSFPALSNHDNENFAPMRLAAEGDFSFPSSRVDNLHCDAESSLTTCEEWGVIVALDEPRRKFLGLRASLRSLFSRSNRVLSLASSEPLILSLDSILWCRLLAGDVGGLVKDVNSFTTISELSPPSHGLSVPIMDDGFHYSFSTIARL